MTNDKVGNNHSSLQSTLTDCDAKPVKIVVTDLDGTLLDHHSYSWLPALPALHLLESLNIPVIYCSSKTGAEIVHLREKTANSAPYIVENGAAVRGLVDENGAITQVFGTGYDNICAMLAAIKAETGYNFVGFADMSVEEVTACTGLSPADARLAKQREFSEPLLWQDSKAALADFVEKLASAGLRAQQGGRFLTVAGDTDKGRALNWLRDYYQKRSGQKRSGQKVDVIALGDSPNDIPMLNAADIAVVIRSDKSDQLTVCGPKQIIYTQERGPAGWNSAMMTILEE